jgi:hypothetical protein
MLSYRFGFAEPYKKYNTTQCIGSALPNHERFHTFRYKISNRPFIGIQLKKPIKRTNPELAWGQKSITIFPIRQYYPQKQRVTNLLKKRSLLTKQSDYMMNGRKILAILSVISPPRLIQTPTTTNSPKRNLHKKKGFRYHRTECLWVKVVTYRGDVVLTAGWLEAKLQSNGNVAYFPRIRFSNDQNKLQNEIVNKR